MTMHFHLLDKRELGQTCLGLFVVCASLGFSLSNFSHAQIATPAPSSAKSVDYAEPIQFAFEKAPWRDVIRWIAQAGEMALHYEDLPTGTFTYSDPADFTHQQAIDRLNLFLLPQGYSLVQSGKLLTVINLSDPRSMQQLDALAPLVTPAQLDERNTHDVVKCLFPLGELEADEAVQELQPLDLMTQPAVFAKTNRIMITDTVAKLQNVRSILEAFEPSTLDNGTIMKTLTLEHVTAEDILQVARPHLGLATGEMIGIDVSISADLLGEHIFVTGVEDKVTLIETLVESLDKPSDEFAAMEGSMVLQAHQVEGENAEMIYNVLITLLAGKTMRLSVDEDAGAIVALTDPQTQQEIASTVAELQATSEDFEVIQLKSADPYFVITLLEQMLDLPDEFADPDEIPPDTPKIDADPANRRLFVRAKPKQMEQIRKIVEGLDSGNSLQASSEKDTIRLLPGTGNQAVGLLETLAKFWSRPNPIFLLPNQGSGSGPLERTLTPPEDRPTAVRSSDGKLTHNVGSIQKLTSTNGKRDTLESARLLTSSSMNSQAPAIRCQLTQRGILVQSDDVEALDAFESQFAAIGGPADSLPSPPVVFYLKYTKPDDALRMLAELLDGGESAREAELGTLVNGSVSSGSFLGSIVTSRDGTLTMMADTITVVADPRLNRLIAQGTASDIERLESYLTIIDKDKGITDVETYGTAHVVELIYTDAEEVAETLRAAYSGRVAGKASSASQQPGNGQPPQPREGEDDKKSKKQATTGRNSQPVRNLEPQMTIAVHAPSNSLIVTAPDQLFAEVQQLILEIDSRSEETVEVVSEANSTLLQSILNPDAQPRSYNSERSRSGSSNSSRRNVDSKSAAIEAFFRRGR